MLADAAKFQEKQAEKEKNARKFRETKEQIIHLHN